MRLPWHQAEQNERDVVLQGTDLVMERPDDDLLTKAKLATFITCLLLCF